MKYLFITFCALGMVMMASAQQYDPAERNARSRIQVSPYPHYDKTDNEAPYDREDINRIYNRRVLDIQNDYTLSRHQQRKMIREINEEREDRLKAIKKWEKKEFRERRREDDRL